MLAAAVRLLRRSKPERRASGKLRRVVRLATTEGLLTNVLVARQIAEARLKHRLSSSALHARILGSAAKDWEVAKWAGVKRRLQILSVAAVGIEVGS